MTNRYLPVRVVGLNVDRTAAAAGVHPEFLMRLVDLGLIPTHQNSSGELRFSTETPARIRTVIRLRNDLSLNYAAVGLVLDLLARIERLENERVIRLEGDVRWT